MSFTKTLLAGAALCALSTAPALAKKAPPAIHVAGGSNLQHFRVHQKSVRHDVRTSNLTYTFYFYSSISEAGFYKVPTILWGETWFDFSTCSVPKEKQTFQKKTAAAKIKVGTISGYVSGCGTIVFPGPLYTLESKTATSDEFTGKLVAKKFLGYKAAILNETTFVTIY